MQEIRAQGANLQYISLEEILANVDNLDFTKITIDTYYMGIVDDEDVKIFLTSKEHPIAYGTSIINSTSEGILIDKEYYLENKEYVDRMLLKIVLKSKSQYLTVIGVDIISDELIDSIIKNSNITDIMLKGMDDESFVFTEELFKKVKECGHIESVNTDAVAPELEDNFDPIIEYNNKNLLFYYNHNELVNMKDKLTISSHSKLNYDEIKNIKYLNDECTIKFDADNYDYLVELMKTLRSEGKPNKVVINVNDKNKFNSFAFDNADVFSNGDVVIDMGLDKYDFNTYLNYEKRLFDMIKPALNLSPLERYLYAYNIVKHYKPYKENEENKHSARNVYDIIR